MRIGDSFFIPCLECKRAKFEIRLLARSFGIEVKIKERTEEYVKGLRTWRIR